MTPRCLPCHCGAAVGKDDAHAARAFHAALHTEHQCFRHPPWRRSVTASRPVDKNKVLASAVYQLSSERQKIDDHRYAEADRIAIAIARKELSGFDDAQYRPPPTTSRPASSRPKKYYEQRVPDETVCLNNCSFSFYQPRIIPSELCTGKPRTVADHFKRMRPLSAQTYPSN